MEDTNSHIDELNENQKQAVLHTKGPIMVLAGAGAGKTKTITHRIAHLVESGIAPQSILAVTFTNKAAGEMRERVATLLGSVQNVNLPLSIHADPRLPFVATFHSLGVRLLREFGPSHLSIPRSFSIWDRADSTRAVKQILKSMDLDKAYEPKTILSRISREKGDARTIEMLAENTQNSWDEVVVNVWDLYEKNLKSEHALDFDDLLLKTLGLLNAHADVVERLRARWCQIIIDEYQDTNQVQFEIAKLLAEPNNNICVVGDVDQNIFTWRGANTAHLLSFEDAFPGAKTVVLEQNYRSTKTILAVADDVIKKNQNRYDKTLFTENKDGDPIEIYTAHSEVDEAKFVVQKCAELIDAGTPTSEIAVLYRANFQSRVLEQAFLESGVPYKVLGTKFFDRKEVKDVLSYLRLALNPESRVDLARIIGVPPRGIGKATLARMLEKKEELLGASAKEKVSKFKSLLERIKETSARSTPSKTLKFIIKESGLETHLLAGGEEGAERLANLKELVTLAKKYDELPTDEGVERLLEDSALLGEQDNLDKTEKAVSLMTVHASKGLEFDAVFITGLEQGLFPHERHDDGDDEEEERRLFYVALTRARKNVYISHAMMRTIYGERALTEPSEFLSDIDSAYATISQYDEMETRGHARGVDLIDF